MHDRTAQHRRPSTEWDVTPRVRPGRGIRGVRALDHDRDLGTGAGAARSSRRRMRRSPPAPGDQRDVPERRVGREPTESLERRRTRPSRSSRAAEANRPFASSIGSPDDHRGVARTDERPAPRRSRGADVEADVAPLRVARVRRRARPRQAPRRVGEDPEPAADGAERPPRSERPDAQATVGLGGRHDQADLVDVRDERERPPAPAVPRTSAVVEPRTSPATTAPKPAASRRTIAATAPSEPGWAGCAQELVEQRGDRHRPEHYATADGDPRVREVRRRRPPRGRRPPAPDP